MTPAPAVVESTPAIDNWSERFDAAQRRFRERNAKPAGPVPFTGDPTDPAFLHDPDFYQKFIRTPELVKARLDAVSANIARVEAELDARDDREIPTDDPADFSTDPRWEERWTTTEETPAPLTVEELLRGVPHYGTDGPASRRADADDLARAHEAGYQLGTDGFTIRDVAPPAYMAAAECDHFMAGLEAGEARLWADFARDMEVMADREATMEALYGFPHAEINEAELASCGCR
jgi:hypothetical protein